MKKRTKNKTDVLFRFFFPPLFLVLDFFCGLWNARSYCTTTGATNSRLNDLTPLPDASTGRRGGVFLILDERKNRDEESERETKQKQKTKQGKYFFFPSSLCLCEDVFFLSCLVCACVGGGCAWRHRQKRKWSTSHRPKPKRSVASMSYPEKLEVGYAFIYYTPLKYLHYN